MQRHPLDILLARSHSVLSKQLDESQNIIQKGIMRQDRAYPSWPGATPKPQQEALSDICLRGIHVSSTLWSNVLAHCLSLQHLTTRDVDSKHVIHLWSYLTLARVVVEAATLFCELNDPNVDDQVRAARAGASIYAGYLAEFRYAEASAKSVGTINRIERQMNQFRELLSRAGFSIKEDRRGREIALIGGGEEYAFKANTTSSSRKWLVNSIAAYETGSAVTHSSWWFLLPSLDIREGKLFPVFDPKILAISINCCLDSLLAMSSAIAPGDQMAPLRKLETKTENRIEIITQAEKRCPKIPHP